MCIHFLLAGVVFSPQSALAFQYAQVAHTLHQVVVFGTPHHGCCCHGGLDSPHGNRLATGNDFHLIQRSILVTTRFTTGDFYIFDGYRALTFIFGLKAYSTTGNLSAGGQAFGNHSLSLQLEGIGSAIVVICSSKHYSLCTVFFSLLLICFFVPQLLSQRVQHICNLLFIIGVHTIAAGDHVNAGAFYRFLDNGVAANHLSSIIFFMLIVDVGPTTVVVNGQITSIIAHDGASFFARSATNEFANGVASQFGDSIGPSCTILQGQVHHLALGHAQAALPRGILGIQGNIHNALLRSILGLGTNSGIVLSHENVAGDLGVVATIFIDINMSASRVDSIAICSGDGAASHIDFACNLSIVVANLHGEQALALSNNGITVGGCDFGACAYAYHATLGSNGSVFSSNLGLALNVHSTNVFIARNLSLRVGMDAVGHITNFYIAIHN